MFKAFSIGCLLLLSSPIEAFRFSHPERNHGHHRFVDNFDGRTNNFQRMAEAVHFPFFFGHARGLNPHRFEKIQEMSEPVYRHRVIQYEILPNEHNVLPSFDFEPNMANDHLLRQVGVENFEDSQSKPSRNSSKKEHIQMNVKSKLIKKLKKLTKEKRPESHKDLPEIKPANQA